MQPQQYNTTLQTMVTNTDQRRPNKILISNQINKHSDMIPIEDASPTLQNHQNQYICRICLENCPNIQFCNCIKGLLSHEECLIKFLQKKQQRQQQRQHYQCQICKYSYKLEYDNKCKLSVYKSKYKIQQNPYKCLVYSIFFFLAFLFYAFLGYSLTNQRIQKQIFTIIMIVTICVSLLFMFFLGVWFFEYIVIIKKKILKVQPKKNLSRKNKKIGTVFPVKQVYDSSFIDLAL